MASRALVVWKKVEAEAQFSRSCGDDCHIQDGRNRRREQQAGKPKSHTQFMKVRM